VLVKIFGVPGAGKTTQCVDIILHLIGHTRLEETEYLAESYGKYSLLDICFTTFTRSGIESVMQKMQDKGYDKGDMPYFATMNKLTWGLSGFNYGHILQLKEKTAFFSDQGVSTKAFGDEDYSEADEVQNFYNFVIGETLCGPDTLTRIELEDLANTFGESGMTLLRPGFLIDVTLAFRQYILEKSQYTHIDSLLRVHKGEYSINKPVLIVDEAQDLNKIQQEIISIWERAAELLVLSGDDDQTVHEWNGADPTYLINHSRNISHKIMLEKSHRLNAKVAGLCNDIGTEIKVREQKNIVGLRPGGKVTYTAGHDFGGVFNLLTKLQETNKRVFLLFRTNRIKRRFERELFISSPVVFSGIDGKGFAYYSLEFYTVSNALNKLDLGLDLQKAEVLALFDKLDGRECLLPNATGTIAQDDRQFFTTSEVLNLTRKWKAQHTLVDLSNKYRRTVKDDIIDFIFFNTKSKKTWAVQNKNIDIQSKLREIKHLFIDTNEKFLIQCGTFHSAKGLEADHVVVFLGTSGTFNNMTDSEIRCFYTACSRSIDELHFVGTNMFSNESSCLEDFFEKKIKKAV
jgi:hypothetical protein